MKGLILLALIVLAMGAYPTIIFHGIGGSCDSKYQDTANYISEKTGEYATCMEIFKP
jgi:hypothetical protein